MTETIRDASPPSVKLAIVGCGVIGRVHAHWAQVLEGVDLVAVADSHASAAEDCARLFGAKKCFHQLSDLWADDEVEAVVLALPAHVRGPLAVAALDAGKHVLLEKPAAMHAREIERIAAARGSRLVGCCSSRYALLPHARAAAAHLATGALGPIRTVHIRAIWGLGPRTGKTPPSWRLRRDLNGGGLLMNWGCYDLDYMLSIAGWQLRPRWVLGRTWPIAEAAADRAAPGSDAETHGVAVVTCEGGEVLTVERAEFSACASEEAWRIVGTRGSLRLRMSPGKGKELMFDLLDSEKGIESTVLWRGDEDSDMGHRSVLEDFVAAVAQGRDPATTLARAHVIQTITDAIYESSRTGLPVPVRGADDEVRWATATAGCATLH